MSEQGEAVWYDGALRERSDAVARMERDAIAFLRRAIAEFEADDSAWLLLIEALAIPDALDDPAEYGYATISHDFHVEVGDGRVALRLAPQLRRRLEATFAALTKQSWSVDARLHPGAIDTQVRGLAPQDVLRLEKRVTAQRAAVAANLARGVAQLASLASPSPLPTASAALDEGLRQVAEIAAAKVKRIRAASA
ncbi:MAG: hypothetical protein R3B13_19160 [Polyangiaceae bacterium]